MTEVTTAALERSQTWKRRVGYAVSLLLLVVVSIPHWADGLAGLVWAAVLRGIYCWIQSRRDRDTPFVSPWLFALAVLCALFSVIGRQSASAATTGTTYAVSHHGVTCEWRTELGGSAVCQRSDGTGLVVVMSQTLVMVQNAVSKVIFWRNQPEHSRGFGDMHDNRITHTVTHNNVRCFWTTVSGGGAFCNKANNHGYVAGVTQLLVMVSTESSKVVLMRSQP